MKDKSKRKKEKSEKKKEESKAAKDFVNLTHVETKKQKVDYHGMIDALSQKEAYDEQLQFRQKLTSDEQAILTSFQKKESVVVAHSRCSTYWKFVWYMAIPFILSSTSHLSQLQL